VYLRFFQEPKKREAQFDEVPERGYLEYRLNRLHRLSWLLTDLTQIVLSKMNLKNLYGSLRKL